MMLGWMLGVVVRVLVESRFDALFFVCISYRDQGWQICSNRGVRTVRG